MKRAPTLLRAIERAARDMRQHGWTESTTFAPPQLLKRSTVGEFLEGYARTLVAAGSGHQMAIADANLLSIHAFSILTYELHRKKTFWVDESLAFMVGCTRLDVRGDGLRLPFPCFALVFTDRETLELAEAVARTDPSASVAGLPLRGLTVYATQLPTTRGVLGLHLAFLLDADTDTWPWLHPILAAGICADSSDAGTGEAAPTVGWCGSRIAARIHGQLRLSPAHANGGGPS